MKTRSSFLFLKTRILGSTIALLFVLSFLGCAEDKFTKGYNEGYQKGLKKGQKEGYDETFEKTFEAAEPEAYDERLDDLIAKDQFAYHKGFLALSIVGGLLVGFCAQYGVFLLLRRQLVLIDIDQMILGKSIAADLHRRSPEEIFRSISDRLNETAGPAPRHLSS